MEDPAYRDNVEITVPEEGSTVSLGAQTGRESASISNDTQKGSLTVAGTCLAACGCLRIPLESRILHYVVYKLTCDHTHTCGIRTISRVGLPACVYAAR